MLDYKISIFDNIKNNIIRYIFFAFCLFMVFMPSTLSVFKYRLFLKVPTYIVFIIYYIIQCYKLHRIDKYLVFYVLFVIYMSIVTLYYNGFWENIIYTEGLMTFAVIIFINQLFQSSDKINLLKIVYFYLFILILYDYIFEVFFGEYMLENPGYNFYYYFPILLIDFILLNIENSKIHNIFRTILFIMIVHVSLIWRQEIQLLLVLVYYFWISFALKKLLNNNKWNDLLNNLFLYLIPILILFVLVDCMGSQSWISSTLSKYVGKELNGRLNCYDHIVPKILERPIFGYGYFKKESPLVYEIFYDLSTAHSRLFQALVNGGLFGLLLYLNFELPLFINICKYKNGYIKASLLAMLFCLFFRGIFLHMPNNYYMFSFSMIYYLISTDDQIYLKL